jgi:hypothetical protein
MRNSVGRAVGAAALLASLVGVATSGATVAAATSMLHTNLHAAHVFNDNVSSTNWGGYAVSGAPFTDAKGSWVEPTATCTSRTAQYASFWVGIDGYSSNSVEQLGTDSDCTGRGRASYYAWWEMYPQGSVALSQSTYPVKPGDTLTAEVSVSGTTFTLSLHSSEGWTFSTQQSGSGLSQASAEWIAESPSLCNIFRCTLAQLANFGTVTFTNAQAAISGGTAQPISSFTASGGPHNITCVTSNGTTVRDSSSSLASGGAGFTTTWKHT